MEKILLAINPSQISMNAIDFACYIANLTRSRLTGIFLQQDTAVKQRSEIGVVSDENAQVHTSRKADTPSIDESIDIFREACQNRGVNCYVHFDSGSPIEELINETRFADILIAGPELSFLDKREGAPTAFVKELLSQSECPVIIAPYDFDSVEEVLFCYDGSASSVFAIRQFTYLFPEFSEKKAVVLQIVDDGKIMVTEKDKIRELLQMHYSSIGFHVLKGIPGEELFNHLVSKKNMFVVMGAFGRKMLSGFWKKSTANRLMQVVDLPIFVAHH
jgi:nucleotide-binding universal stress UspA family protein